MDENIESDLLELSFDLRSAADLLEGEPEEPGQQRTPKALAGQMRNWAGDLRGSRWYEVHRDPAATC